MTGSPRLPDPLSPNGKDVYVPASRAGWRRWLEDQPDRTDGVWVVFPKQSSDLDGPRYVDLVEEALCFGWIDSTARRADADRTIQWFSPRRKGGVWSALNKERVERLAAEGRMTDRGQAVIDAARADGSWSQYDDVEALVVHPDLRAAFDTDRAARTAFEAMAPSQQKQHLWWVYSAKRPETRKKRIVELLRGIRAGE